jgi:hypothetical protein
VKERYAENLTAKVIDFAKIRPQIVLGILSVSQSLGVLSQQLIIFNGFATEPVMTTIAAGQSYFDSMLVNTKYI